VGVAEYSEEAKRSWNLDYDSKPAAIDAKTIAEVLQQRRPPQKYNRVVPTVLTDPQQTTGDCVRKTLNQIMDLADGDDTVVFYYTGHSQQVESETDGRKSFEFHLIPSDGDAGLTAGGFLQPYFCERVEPVKVLILDSCSSGTALHRIATNTIAKMGEDGRKLGFNTWFFAACPPGKEARQQDKGGVFTQAVIAGLGDKWPTEVVTADQLWTYLIREDVSVRLGNPIIEPLRDAFGNPRPTVLAKNVHL
jgi:hypothetical protein